MAKIFALPIILTFIFLLNLHAAAQKKDRTESVPHISADFPDKKCNILKRGGAVHYPKPAYPSEAANSRIGGTVKVSVLIDEKGKISEIVKTEGNRLLQGAALNAAGKTRFSTTICDGASVGVSAVLDYHFIPFITVENYFKPEKLEDFADVPAESEFYEAILNLTENYRLTFGYDNKNFYPDAPLTRGDFAHFLRLSLDLLFERARAVNKIPRSSKLFFAHNPQNLNAVEKIIDFDRKQPFAESVKTLLLKYDIALTNEKSEFQGRNPLTQNQAIEIWTKIFGAEAVPVNFEKIQVGDRILTRGEFALFLYESLQVLTYKVLP